MTREFPKNPEPQNIALPTVGRIVLYQENCRSQQYPAMVVEVVPGSLTITTACVFLHDGTRMELGLPHSSELPDLHGRSPLEHASWDWMPFQKGQAAKTEELEREAEQMARSFYGVDRNGRTQLPMTDEMGKQQASAPSPVDGKR